MSKANTDSSTTTASEEEGGTDLASMKKLFMDQKVDGNKTVWSMTKETFGMADGKNKKDDIYVNSVAEGMEILKEYLGEIQKSKEATKEKQQQGTNKDGTPKVPGLDLVPIKEFNCTLEDVLVSFLKWTEKIDDKTSKTSWNVSKARRRFDSYLEWMEENAQGFAKAPLTKESITAAAKVWDIQITHDDDGRFLWWIDLSAMDKEAIKKVSTNDHVRYIVWFSHLVMLDKKAQENGAMILEDLGMMGFWKMATLVPADVGAKMDRLTIGILPVRMKKIYVFGAAKWMSLLMTLMKPFMGKKMRERMVLVPNKTDVQTFCDDLVKRKNIPQDFSGIQGEVAKDEFFNKY